MPSVVTAQSPIVIKMQSSWTASDIFHEMAGQYVTRVEAMSGGKLKIDLTPAGAIVGAFQVLDAVNDGVLDASHTVPVYWYGKNKAASFFGTGPVFGGTLADHARLVLPGRRQGALQGADAGHPRPQRLRLLRHADAGAALRLVQEAGDLGRPTSRASNTAPSASRPT